MNSIKMEELLLVISKYLGIPKSQLRLLDTSRKRVQCYLTYSWINDLLKERKYPRYTPHDTLSYEDMQALLNENGPPPEGYQTVLICVYDKYSQEAKALGLAKPRKTHTDDSLYFSQLLHYISHTNYKNLWKHTFKKYYSECLAHKEDQSHHPRGIKPANDILMEIFCRIYGCPIFTLTNQTITRVRVSEEFNCHPNLLPAYCVFECDEHFLVLHNFRNSGYHYHSLLDLVTFGPKVFSEHYDKALFLIYQFAEVFKHCHDRGILLGNLQMADIFTGHNLFLQMIPDLSSNVFQVCEGNVDPQPRSFDNTSIPRPSPSTQSLSVLTARWVRNDLSNLDYLLALNVVAGRKFGHPGCHFIIPWVSDLTTQSNGPWRDLTKSQYRLNKGDRQLDLTFATSHHHVSDVLSEITYYVYMARRTPQSVLRAHVRSNWVPEEYPSSIQRLLQWTPDESIPEFYTDPSVFKSIHEDLRDLQVPSWAGTPEQFVAAHRDMLESQRVSEKLHHWIDLTFGYKLTGTPAIKAKNVCLNLAENNTQLSTRGIVQIFDMPHPRKNIPHHSFDKQPPRATILKWRAKTDNESSDNEITNSSSIVREDAAYSKKHATNTPTTTTTSPYALIDSLEKRFAFHWHVFRENPCCDDNCGSKSEIIDHVKKQVAAKRLQEIPTLGCLIMELFLHKVLRTTPTQTIELRIAACARCLTHENLPFCVKSVLKTMFAQQFPVTNIGLPPMSAHQLLEPLLQPFLLPFPLYFPAFYSAVNQLKTLEQCDGAAEFRVQLFAKRVAELVDSKSVDIVVPYVLDLLAYRDTLSCILRTSLLDRVFVALGIKRTNELLLDTIRKLYENNVVATDSILFSRRFLTMLCSHFGLSTFLRNFLPFVIESLAAVVGNQCGGENAYRCISNEEILVPLLSSIRPPILKTDSPQTEIAIFPFDKEESCGDDSDTTMIQYILEHLANNSDDEKDDDDTTSSDCLIKGPLVRSPDIAIPGSNNDSSNLHLDGGDFGAVGSVKSHGDANVGTDLLSSERLNDDDYIHQLCDHDISASSILWFCPRFGPVLTAKFVARNLLRVLAFCFTGESALTPCSITEATESKFQKLSVTKYTVHGDENAHRVLFLLSQIVHLYGEQFILLQYLPTICELVTLSRSRLKPLTVYVEGSLIGSLALVQIIIALLSESSIMNCLKEVLIDGILDPIIDLLVSRNKMFPSKCSGRRALASKFIDTLYCLVLKIGTEMTRLHLSVPVLVKLFLAFDTLDDHVDDEVSHVFCPKLAYLCYCKFSTFLGANAMQDCLLNYPYIRDLCVDYEEQMRLATINAKPEYKIEKILSGDSADGNYFGSPANLVGNKIEINEDTSTSRYHHQNLTQHKKSYFYRSVSNSHVDRTTTRHLRGNWLAYWEYEVGQCLDQNLTFAFKQIKLQTFVGHTNSIRALLSLNNESNFISASRDKTVKLWAIRNQGDGSATSSCQLSYSQHRKPLRGVAYFESSHLVASCDSTIHVWDPFVCASERTLHIIDKFVTVSIIRSVPNRLELLAAFSDSMLLRLVDVRIGSYVCEYKISWNPTGCPRAMCVSPKGDWVAVGQSTGILTVIDVRIGLVLTTWKAHEGEILQMIAVDEHTLVTSSLDHVIGVWNVHDGKLKCHLKGLSEPAHSLRLRSDNELIVGTSANRIGVYATLDGQSEFVSNKLRSDSVKGVLTAMEVLPENRTFLVGCDTGLITLLA